ncbi:MAG: flagellar hook-length control protein FliK [Antarcticimicrobium sp.]|uniref:flagellar hook-length control protein FliK n=1 Tax=Antarcticimicrobium sp. TaxID=2824147 RepID=UPI002608151B|nr:flagellar hook-length control protein FliK [Antarcticimicrobium sp.]MDF1716266.1 flagellar hook-length control protein FliK [Antarcticimicrobium sp.]
MSDAISLLSVLVGARPGASAAPEKALPGFSALFSQGSDVDGAGSETGAQPAGAAKLKALYNFLAGLGKKASHLDAEGDDPAATLEAVAGLASDLTVALADFERETGAGLISVLQAASTDGGIVVTAEGADAPGEVTDPAAAVQALKSVIATISDALRGISATVATNATEAETTEAGSVASRIFMAAAVLPDETHAQPATASVTASAAGPRVSSVSSETRAAVPAVGTHAAAPAVGTQAVALVAKTQAVEVTAETQAASVAADAQAAAPAVGTQAVALVAKTQVVAMTAKTQAALVAADAQAAAPAVGTQAAALDAETRAMEVSAETKAAVMTARGETGTQTAARAAAMPVPAAPAPEAKAPILPAGGAQPQADLPVFPFVLSSAQAKGSVERGAPKAQALLARVVAVAADLSATATASAPGSAVDAAMPVVAGGATVAVMRRLGGIDPLITSEDVARAMAQGSQPGREPMTAPHRATEAEGDASRFGAAVTSQIRSAEIGEGRTRIELSPRGLGSIEVEISTGSDGALKVVVRAENPTVLNALREERNLLAQALGGLDMGSLDLQSFTEGNFQEPQGDRSAGRSTSSGEEIAATGARSAPVHTAMIGDGRLDIVT